MALQDLLNKPDARAGKDKRKIDPATDKPSQPNVKIGKRFEDKIQLIGDLYLAKKIAYIQRYHVPTMFIKTKQAPQGTMIYRAKTGFDFVGVEFKTGKALFVEAKSTREGSLPIWQEKTGLKTHQLEILIMLSSLGVKCIILWEIRDAEIVYRFTPEMLIKAAGERKSITISICQENRFPVVVPTKIGVTDYLDFLGEL